MYIISFYSFQWNFLQVIKQKNEINILDQRFLIGGPLDTNEPPGTPVNSLADIHPIHGYNTLSKVFGFKCVAKNER